MGRENNQLAIAETGSARAEAPIIESRNTTQVPVEALLVHDRVSGEGMKGVELKLAARSFDGSHVREGGPAAHNSVGFWNGVVDSYLDASLLILDLFKLSVSAFANTFAMLVQVWPVTLALVAFLPKGWIVLTFPFAAGGLTLALALALAPPILIAATICAPVYGLVAYFNKWRSRSRLES